MQNLSVFWWWNETTECGNYTDGCTDCKRCLLIHQMLGTRISDTLPHWRPDCLTRENGQDMIEIYQVKTKRYKNRSVKNLQNCYRVLLNIHRKSSVIQNTFVNERTWPPDAVYGYKNKSHVHDTGKAVERWSWRIIRVWNACSGTTMASNLQKCIWMTGR